ncbi:hypothetical protein GCM10007103_32060 [Salinimicrobium marinum]|uniref:Uncharacterized protein n=1 Tax=Salinimicrobium marinum TaxID=680283 RepID=A0A918SLY0_9FLAO|nr:hypothetical protein [Salinimicrobium marinum]GHA48695.1 hypothetical protein GCM10007103_32060 [Salinimicrobium marinum]
MDNRALEVGEQVEYDPIFDGQKSRFEMREMMVVDSKFNFLKVANAASGGAFYNDLENQERFVRGKIVECTYR